MYEYPELVINNPSKFVLIGPQYWNTNYNPSSGQHMLGIGYRQCAEYAGRAIQRLRDGLASEAVYVTAVSNSGLTLTITFNTQSQLAHDASLVSDPNGQWGIELTANGSNVELLDPAIVGTNQIQFTLASSITGMSCVLGVAEVAPSELFGSTSGPTTSARAPIHELVDRHYIDRRRRHHDGQLRLRAAGRLHRSITMTQYFKPVIAVPGISAPSGNPSYNTDNVDRAIRALGTIGGTPPGPAILSCGFRAKKLPTNGSSFTAGLVDRFGNAIASGIYASSIVRTRAMRISTVRRRSTYRR